MGKPDNDNTDSGNLLDGTPQSLHGSETRLRLLTENAPHIIAELDLEGRITYLSRSMYGLSVEEAIGKDFCTWTLPEYHTIMRESFEFTVKNGQPRPYQSATKMPDGEIRHYFSVLTPVMVAGRVNSVIVTSNDITSRVKTEEKLRESEKRHLDIIEAAIDGFWLVNLSGRLVEVNEAYARMSGYSVQEMVAMHISDLEATETKEDVSNHMLRVISIGEDHFETRHRRKDGTLFDVEVNIKYLPDDGGWVIAFLHDITLRNQWVKHLRESELKLKHIIRDTHVGVLLQGPDAEILLSNPQALELLGLSESQLLGKTSFDPYWNVIHEDGSPFISSDHPVPLAIETRQPVRDVVMGVARPSKGDRVWLLVFAEPQLNSDGTVEQVVCTFIDITARKHAEEVIKQLNSGLEDRIRERTWELITANAALESSEEKYRTVADFTYNWEYWTDPEGNFIYNSPACERITGYPEADFVRDPGLLEKIILPEDAAIFKSHVHEKGDKNVGEMEFRIVTRDGDVRWISHICQPVYGVNETYLGTRASNHDITAKIKAENEISTIAIEVEERERNHFSRELHDSLGPVLSTIKLYFQWLSETNDPEKVGIITAKGNFNIDKAIQVTREMSKGLSSLLMTNTGFVEAVLDFTGHINDSNALSISFEYNTAEKFNGLIENTLYRITTELINNTLRHARATQMDISFVYNGKRNILFSYKDNGIGFNHSAQQHKPTGFGLLSIQNRVKTLRGKIKIDTGPGKGIKVEITIPAAQKST
ncbi:MAG: PAS domain-containing sensor histidine kinase [Bacteroidales bacterium]